MLDQKRAMRFVLALIGAFVLSTGCNKSAAPTESVEKDQSDATSAAQKSPSEGRSVARKPVSATSPDRVKSAPNRRDEEAAARLATAERKVREWEKRVESLQRELGSMKRLLGFAENASIEAIEAEWRKDMAEYAEAYPEKKGELDYSKLVGHLAAEIRRLDAEAATKRPAAEKTDAAEKQADDDFKDAFSNIGQRDGKNDADREARTPTKIVRLPPPDAKRFPGLKHFHPDYDVWLDDKNKRVVLQSEVCLRDGALELFACIHRWIDDPTLKGSKLRRGTKEHESILTINTTAKLVHTGLLLSGADNGSPARFRPKYVPAHGSEIEITLHWQDGQGKWQTARAQDWVRDHKTKKEMTHRWVFAGSRFWVNERTGERIYTAESGDLICVSNFDTAVLDLPIESSGANEGLLFEAFTERIPQAVLGLTVAEVEGGGCKITSVEKNSPASRAGLMVGDVIIKAEYEKLTGLKHWNRLHAKQRPTQEMLLDVKRGEKSFTKRLMPDGRVVTMVLTPKPTKKKPAAPAK